MFKNAVLAVLMTALFAGTGFSMKYMELKDALGQAFPQGSKLFKNDVEMSAAQAKQVNDACKTFYKKGDKTTIYIAKDPDSNIVGFCMIMTKVLSPYSSMHKLAFIFDGNLNLKQITVLELSDAKAYAYKINDKAFLDQFTKVKDLNKAQLGKDIDAESGATESSQLLLENLKASSFILKMFYGAPK